MSSEIQFADLEALTESATLECKAAAGPDGRGKLPDSFWESYSAMANTDGGVILLGLAQSGAWRFRVSGIAEPERLVKELWDLVHNRQKVSAALLREGDVAVVDLAGVKVVKVTVPRAARTVQPVYIGANPLKGTYRRRSEGDYLCDEDTVRRMLAEQRDTPRDATILSRHSLADLDAETLRAYRQVFQNRQPDHPWVARNDRDFLEMLGGWTRDRESGAEGLTLAGLLMFGQLRPILDAAPNYIVDYQEQPDNDETRWTDRVTTDGAWSGNLYDFFRRVMPRLTRDLKVPFRLKDDTRVDDTPVHQALREAFVNMLIHADYSGRVSVLVIKRPAEFVFRNPGTMRVPRLDAFRGGASDCRNRALQKMFQMIGLGEQAGSGLPKIFRHWEEQHWRLPNLEEAFGAQDRTTLALSTESLLPANVMAELDQRFGVRFRSLSEAQRTALATVVLEDSITHGRLRELCLRHPHDLTKELSALVSGGFLVTRGATRGTRYYFPEKAPAEVTNPGNKVPITAIDGEKHPQLSHKGAKDPSEPSEMSLSQRSTDAESDKVGGAQLSHKGSELSHKEGYLNPRSLAWAEAWLAAGKVRDTGRATPMAVNDLILRVCAGHFVSTSHLGELLGRTPRMLTSRYLAPLVAAGKLELRYPGNPRHPDQAYRVKGSSS